MTTAASLAPRAPACPHCRGELGAAELAAAEVAGTVDCPHCRRRFAARPFAPRPRVATVRRLAEAGPAAGAACAEHPGNLAEGACERCGVFYCGLCEVTVEGGRYCATCFERARLGEDLPFLVVRYRSLRAAARLVAVLGLLIWPFGFLLGPLAVFLAARAAKQERRLEPGSSLLGLWGIAALGLFDLALFLVLVAAFVAAIRAAG